MRRETLGNLIHISDCEPEAGAVTVVYKAYRQTCGVLGIYSCLIHDIFLKMH